MPTYSSALPAIPREPETPSAAVAAAPPPAMPAVHADEDPAAERAREAAFDAAFRWHGKTLLPFTSSRKSLLMQHRLAMGAPDFFRCMMDVHGFIADAARILFLCSHAPGDPLGDAPDAPGWETLRCEPPRLQAAVDAWHDAHIQPAEELEACRLAMAIYECAQQNRHEPAPAPRVSADALGN